jgi:hypothetical protein
MAKSLFHKNSPEDSSPKPSPYDLIGHEIGHLKKGSSVRHGTNVPASMAPWVIALALCGVAWLYVMDPVIHAWDKGEAVRVYLYLHNYDPGETVDKLVASQIFSPDEVEVLNHRSGSFQDYFVSPEAANRKAEAITTYMAGVKLLHAGEYEKLDPVGKIRYTLFIHPWIFLPTRWSFLDPTVSE